MYAVEKEFAGECGFFGGLSLKEREREDRGGYFGPGLGCV